MQQHILCNSVTLIKGLASFSDRAVLAAWNFAGKMKLIDSCRNRSCTRLLVISLTPAVLIAIPHRSNLT